MNGSKSGAVGIFIGVLLIVIFVVGLAVDRNPRALSQRYRDDLSVEQFGWFCSQIWLPAGIIGIPLFLISLITSLVRERKNKQ